jgi:hypothetical protein
MNKKNHKINLDREEKEFLCSLTQSNFDIDNSFESNLQKKLVKKLKQQASQSSSFKLSNFVLWGVIGSLTSFVFIFVFYAPPLTNTNNIQNVFFQKEKEDVVLEKISLNKITTQIIEKVIFADTSIDAEVTSSISYISNPSNILNLVNFNPKDEENNKVASFPIGSKKASYIEKSIYVEPSIYSQCFDNYQNSEYTISTLYSDKVIIERVFVDDENKLYVFNENDNKMHIIISGTILTYDKNLQDDINFDVPHNIEIQDKLADEQPITKPVSFAIESNKNSIDPASIVLDIEEDFLKLHINTSLPCNTDNVFNISFILNPVTSDILGIEYSMPNLTNQPVSNTVNQDNVFWKTNILRSDLDESAYKENKLAKFYEEFSPETYENKLIVSNLSTVRDLLLELEVSQFLKDFAYEKLSSFDKLEGKNSVVLD